MSMIDLYEIGVSFIIQRDVFSDLETMKGGMAEMQAAIDAVNTSLRTTTDMIATASGSARGMASAFERAADAAQRMADAAGRTGFGGGGGGGAGEGGSGGGYLVPPPPGGSGGGGDEGPRLLPPLGGGEPGQPGQPGGGRQHDASPWDYIILGGAAYEAGKNSLTAVYNSAAEVQHQGILMQNQGATPGDAQEAIAAAQELQRQYPGLTQAQAMVIIRDAYTQSVDKGKRQMPEAIAMAKTLTQAAYVLQSEGNADAAEQLINVSRAGELRGLLNDHNPDGSLDLGPFNSFIGAFTRVAQSTGGRVSPQDALTILKNAGPEGIMMDQDAMTNALILSQTMGADKVGTGLNALAIQFLGGKMSQGAAQNLHKAGLLPDDMFDPETGKILDKYKNGLGQVLLPNGSLKGGDEFMHNPFGWIRDVYDPAVAHMAPGDQQALLSSILADSSRIPGARLIAETLFQAGFVQRQEDALKGTPDMQAATANLKQDPQNVAGGLGAAFGAFLAQIGSDAMPTATAQLKGLTDALNGLTDWAKEHPDAGKAAFLGLEGGTGVGLVGGLYGAYRLASLAYRGVFGGGKAAGAAEAGGDAAFADSAATAGADAIPLTGLEGGATAAGGITGGLLGAAIATAITAAVFKLQKEMVSNGLDPRMLAGGFPMPDDGKPIPVSIVASPGGGLPVQVTNTHDIAKGSIGYLEHQFGLMPNGPTGPNPTMSPYLPGTDAPGAHHP